MWLEKFSQLKQIKTFFLTYVVSVNVAISIFVEDLERLLHHNSAALVCAHFLHHHLVAQMSRPHVAVLVNCCRTERNTLHAHLRCFFRKQRRMEVVYW